ncbi:hypothetical protein [Helicobacter canadensis]|nr:hypothetical protein [Helicobacter canadensis]EFR49192.1 hypothetical protein HCMG_01365 [Helicobacter canadensis MIT 98-5491]
MILEQIQENDILIFLDIGFEFNPNKHDLLLEMVAQVEENEIMGLDAGLEHCAEKYWNKADLLAHYGLLDDKEFLDSPQMIGGAIFCKKTFRVCNIIQEWLNVFYEHYNFVDDSPSKIPNLPTFRENRHDQSVWNIIAKREKVKSFPSSFYWERDEKVALSCNRNKIYLPHDVKKQKNSMNL